MKIQKSQSLFENVPVTLIPRPSIELEAYSQIQYDSNRSCTWTGSFQNHQFWFASFLQPNNFGQLNLYAQNWGIPSISYPRRFEKQ